MFNPNDFDADLHLTLVLMSVVFTLMGLHLMQFILAGRNRASTLEEILGEIRADENTRERTFKRNLVSMKGLVQDIQDEVSSDYDDIIIDDLAAHEIRTIKSSQASNQRSEKIEQCLGKSKEVDQRLFESVPRNTATVEQAETTLDKIHPITEEIARTIIEIRREHQRTQALNNAIDRLEDVQASTERSLAPIRQRYER